MNMIHTNLEFYKALIFLSQPWYVMSTITVALSKLHVAFGSIVVQGLHVLVKSHTTIDFVEFDQKVFTS